MSNYFPLADLMTTAPSNDGRIVTTVQTEKSPGLIKIAAGEEAVAVAAAAVDSVMIVAAAADLEIMEASVTTVVVATAMIVEEVALSAVAAVVVLIVVAIVEVVSTEETAGGSIDEVAGLIETVAPNLEATVGALTVIEEVVLNEAAAEMADLTGGLQPLPPQVNALAFN